MLEGKEWAISDVTLCSSAKDGTGVMEMGRYSQNLIRVHNI